MKGIQCRKGHVFSMIIDAESDSAEWKLQEIYYQAQGCEIVKEENLKFSKHDALCSHCDSLEHEIDNLLEQVIDNARQAE